MRAILSTLITVFAITSVAIAEEAAPLYSGDLARAHHYISLGETAYEQISSYQSDFEREIFLDGKVKKSERIFIRFEKPFVIFMGWKSGPSNGQQIVFSENDYDGKLLVRPPGFLFVLIPIVRMDADDPRITKEEKQPISKAGIGYFLTKFAEDFEEAAKEDEVEVLSILKDSILGEPVIRVRVLFKTEGREYPVVSVAFSERHRLPVEMRLFSDGNALSEIYRYLHLTINPDRSHQGFRKSIDRRLLDLYGKIPA